MSNRDKNGSMTFRVNAEEHAAFLLACKAADVSAAQVLRAAMRQFLKEHAQAELDLMTAKPRKGRKNAK